MKALLEHDDCRLVHLHQGAFGARSLKPTTLLCIHLPEMREELDRSPNGGLCTAAQAARLRTSLGLEQLDSGSNRFATAPLKEYPAAFCRRTCSCRGHHTSTCPTTWL